jgi:hypothetical protein
MGRIAVHSFADDDAESHLDGRSPEKYERPDFIHTFVCLASCSFEILIQGDFLLPFRMLLSFRVGLRRLSLLTRVLAWASHVSIALL